MLVLTVIQGPDKGRIFELPADEPQLLGRSSEALPITDNTVSRRHAELTPDDGVWWINDLGSQNGTWVNGARIAERTKLNAGDQVRTGSTMWVYGRAEPRPAGPRRGSGGGAIPLVGGSGTGGKGRGGPLSAEELEVAFERTALSNEDSVVLAESFAGVEVEGRGTAVEHLRVLYRLTTLTGGLASTEELIPGVLELIFEVFRPERGSVVLLEESADEGMPATRTAAWRTDEGPRPEGVRGAAGTQRVPERERSGTDEMGAFAVPRTILSVALQKGEGVLATNALSDPRFGSGDSVQRMSVRSAMCAPIRHRDRTFGAIYIDSVSLPSAFSTEQLALLNAIGQHAGLALANLELHREKIQSERLAAMGETVASLSHSIKNILQGLRGGADVVEMGLKRNDLKVANGGWSILRRNLNRIIGLTMNMLAYSRPRTLEIELTGIGPLLEDCAALVKDQCDAREVALIVDIGDDVPPLPIDQSQIHQALMNLITNAVEAVEPRTGVVIVRAAYKPPLKAGTAEAKIEVVDNGPGIPPEKAAKIFEPFFTTKGLRGTGLGLAVSKRIVEQHGGRIELKSQLAKGSTFVMYLPLESGRVIDPSETR
jgi:two-component system, NtrC family, sensor kinase